MADSHNPWPDATAKIVTAYIGTSNRITTPEELKSLIELVMNTLVETARKQHAK
jgi:predicted transcriptional regulator